MLGTILGVAAFVAVLGLTATASGQVSAAFSVLSATQVTVNDVGAGQDQEGTAYDFPDRADQTIEGLNGVLHAGRTWAVSGGQMNATTTTSNSSPVIQVAVAAASPGYLEALDPTVSSGTLFDAFHEDHHMKVAVLGAAVARQLAITNLADQPAIFLQGVPYTVIGVLADVRREPGALSSVFIPAATALAVYGQPLGYAPASMLIETKVGAAPLIARQAALALRPDKPQILQATPPPDPHGLQTDVLGSLNALFVVLAGITLLIGATGIANTTLVSVMERANEIGLRRAVGARRRHIAWQFLAETAAIGTLGGLIGTAIGVAAVLVVALIKSWTAVLDPALTLPAPLIGTITGLLAGLYPAIRAARIQPVEALRR